MPTKPRITFQAWHFEFRACFVKVYQSLSRRPGVEIRVSHLRAMPNYTKQTQFTDPRPKNAKQTQSQPSRILPRWPKVSPESSGNPIPAYPASRLYRACRECRPLFQRNEPNPRTAGVSPAFPYPHYAKRTQSHDPNCQKSTVNSQKMENEPNQTQLQYRIDLSRANTVALTALFMRVLRPQFLLVAIHA